VPPLPLLGSDTQAIILHELFGPAELTGPPQPALLVHCLQLLVPHVCEEHYQTLPKTHAWKKQDVSKHCLSAFASLRALSISLL
jgi:hypothetical protein